MKGLLRFWTDLSEKYIPIQTGCTVLLDLRGWNNKETEILTANYFILYDNDLKGIKG